VVSLLLAAGCGDSTAPEEARFPIVEGIYNVETSIVSNNCGRFDVVDGLRVYVFFQHGGTIEFRPPSFDESGHVELRDLGIQGRLQPDGEFEMTGTYTLSEDNTGPGPIVGFTMTGRFTGDHLEGTERHIPTFPGGSCEVTFSVVGEEV
jgi:hypothetical protein